MLFAKKCDDKYGKNGYCNKTGIDTARTPSKRGVHKTAKDAGDMIGNKISDKITLLGKTKSKVKEDERNLHITRKKTANYR